MKILITQSVTAAADIFAELGELRFIADKNLAGADLTDIDAVIMRSQTTLSPAQVQNTPVKFVGTATAGLDHLPVTELRALGIQVVNAPGCNAASVADYWLSAILSLQQQRLWSFQEKTLGLIGYGAVGQVVAKRAVALGFNVIVNDPPRQAQALPIPFPTLSLTDLLAKADIVSLHVPLVLTGAWPTKHLINDQSLSTIKPGTILINTARGEVCDAKALVLAKTKELIADLIIDVWPQEPYIDKSLWQAATIATPHIAGHAYLAKWQGTWQVHEALRQWLDKPSHTSREALLPTELTMQLTPISQSFSETTGLWGYVQQIYDVNKDHATMQTWLPLSSQERAQAFSQYRTHYPMRSELSLASVLAEPLTPWQKNVLSSAGVSLC